MVREIAYSRQAAAIAGVAPTGHGLPLPNEIGDAIGTSTLWAAWNAAVYVAQIDDRRLSAALADSAYLDATRSVLQQHGGLWFWDESFVISRKRRLA